MKIICESQHAGLFGFILLRKLFTYDCTASVLHHVLDNGASRVRQLSQTLP